MSRHPLLATISALALAGSITTATAAPTDLTPDAPPSVAIPPRPQVWRESLWTITAGESLTDAITRWAKTAGWAVPPQWQTRHRWTILFSTEYRGSFEHAVEWLCSGFTNQAEIPTPIFWPNRVIDLTSTPNPNVAPQSSIGEFQ
ncbi:MAG: TcpQ domain-containing protein [Magnetospirillum sp.]|nr:TcpQ domain-containing protein [Magnetospirillum sp.]